jgi:cytochrome b subunit of formate dehydrogenase
VLTTLFLRLGLTRDDALWFWSRLTSGALLIVSGLVPLDSYVGPTGHKALTVGAVIVLWLAGKYDASSLPGKKDHP